MARFESLERGSREIPDAQEVWEAARSYVWKMTDAASAERWSEDIASEATREWWEKIQRGDEIRNWRGWIKTVVYHRLIKERRRDSRIAPLTEVTENSPDQSHGEVSEQLEGREAVRSLKQAMGSIKSRRQLQVLALSFFQGEDSAEIARRLGMSPEAVRVMKARALDRLRNAHIAAGIKEPLMGAEVGLAAIWALSEKDRTRGPLTGLVEHLSEATRGVIEAARQVVSRLTGGSAGPADAAAGIGTGTATAATGAAVGGGKLVGALCAGAATVCAAGVMATGLPVVSTAEQPGKSLVAPEKAPTVAATSPETVAAAPVEQAPAEASESTHGDERSETSSSQERQAARAKARRQARERRRPVEASASDARGAFGPVVSDAPAPVPVSPPVAQSSGGEGTSASAPQPEAVPESLSGGSGSDASAGQTRSAFGPGF